MFFCPTAIFSVFFIMVNQVMHTTLTMELVALRYQERESNQGKFLQYIYIFYFIISKVGWP